MDMISDQDALTLAVVGKQDVADGIVLFDFARPDGGALPAFTAGAHLLLRTPAGLARRYSLCNAPAERHRYQVAIKREAKGGGGSISMIDNLAVGDTLQTATPTNYFPLDSSAARHLLIAGGIGITPILAMARQLLAEGAPFQLVYCARSTEAAAFLDVLAGPEFAGHVLLHFDGGDPARAMDFAAFLATHPAGTHLYCCGPRPLMQAVRDASRHWPHSAVHFEDFGTSAQPNAAGEKPFRVRLARNNQVLIVPPGTSILDVLRGAGVEAPCSCEAGTCGACRVGLLAGTAEHRDFVLDDDELGSAIMICVSRALSEELTLDV
jgi:phthalate 4,5-dioxygenase reductase subunit